MKQMIAEFAIFANSFVGEYLKINLNTGIFRTCNARITSYNVCYTKLLRTKNAITVLSEINSTTYEPINEIKLLFTTIFVKKENAFSSYNFV